MRFSIIVPVYNVEKYISKCLDSLENQTFKDFEVIIVNDGTKDNSQIIIDKYVEKNPKIFKSYIKENGGLSDARNYGIEKAEGEYLVFVDSDDWIDIDLLEKLNQEIIIDNDIKMIRIPKKTINENGIELGIETQEEMILTGEEAFINLRKKRFCIETAWSYCVKKEFWIKNNFKFPKGKLHEDFATMLIAILKSNKVAFINYSFYNYLVRENSIITNKNYENEVKKAKDILEHYDNNLKELEKIENISPKAKSVFLEYISSSVSTKLRCLKGKELQEYKKELKDRKVIKNIKGKSIKIIIKKIIFLLLLNK